MFDKTQSAVVFSLLLMPAIACTGTWDSYGHDRGHRDGRNDDDRYGRSRLGAMLNQPCETVASSIFIADTEFTASSLVEAGELPVPGQEIPAHCVLTGRMFERTSPVDGQTYAIGFEMRLPIEWNGRYFYQANGGIDGNVVTALGNAGGGGPLVSALQKGFAVISSDAGHSGAQNPLFGLDPQARLDYGYQAVGKLTPMAKAVIETVYGKGPRYSYIGGCSNGGRHAMVAAARYPDQYDGFLVGSPGFNLPNAAVANIYGAQQYAPLAEPGATIPGGPFAGLPDISGAYTRAERRLVADAVLAKCDDLDRLADGIVNRVEDCQEEFSLDDVPTCDAERDGSCLTLAQKVAVGRILAGAVDGTGEPIYAGFPVDAGIATADFEFWEFIAPLILDSGAIAFIMGTPPQNPATFNPVAFSLGSSIDDLSASIYASDAIYTESGVDFMTPPNSGRLREMQRRGGRMIVYHGVSDQIFSVNDTIRWYTGLDARHDRDHHQRGRWPDARSFARLFLVPGMNHCAGGPATDQFDMLTPLMRWVERGKPPRKVIAAARGPGNPGGENANLPADWAPDRTRLLCPYPKVAYFRRGDSETASGFVCR